MARVFIYFSSRVIRRSFESSAWFGENHREILNGFLLSRNLLKQDNSRPSVQVHPLIDALPHDSRRFLVPGAARRFELVARFVPKSRTPSIRNLPSSSWSQLNADSGSRLFVDWLEWSSRRRSWVMHDSFCQRLLPTGWCSQPMASVACCILTQLRRGSSFGLFFFHRPMVNSTCCPFVWRKILV